MKVLKKIGDFFVAMVPFFVYVGVQFVVALLGMFTALAIEIAASSSILETISVGSELFITIVVYTICFLAAFAEMKIHRFKFRDISPVRQNGRVYLLAVFFALGLFFVLKLAEMLFVKVTGENVVEAVQETAGFMIVITAIAYLTECFVEEFVFRGLMTKTFEMRFPVWVGAVIITVTYALWHWDYVKGYSVLFGAVLIFIRYKFEDLKLCFMVHLIVTFMYVAMSMVTWKNYEAMIMIGSIVGIVIVVLSMLFMIKFASKAETVSDQV